MVPWIGGKEESGEKREHCDLFNLKKYTVLCSKYKHSSKVCVQPCELLIQRYTGTLTQALLTEPPNPGGRGQSHTCMTSSCLCNPHEVSGRGEHTSVCVSCPYTLTRAQTPPDFSLPTLGRTHINQHFCRRQKSWDEWRKWTELHISDQR